jgi:signal peptidase I
MGDNRDNSSDSRFAATPGGPGVGYVPFDNLVGPAKVIFFSVRTGENGFEFWKWPWTVRWDRLFHFT